ncbi:HPr family phosphocarrier protein [Kiritimatiellota bacterium B12222]|nr:HPr family phosphocarrier protein [Kiritimatiellota bacterium B12222]
MSAKAKATIMNEAGIHCRPSTHIIKTVRDYPGRMQVTHAENGSCHLTSMLDLMILGLTCGSEVEIEVEGPDEELQLKKLVELFEHIYDFPDAGM